MKRLTIEDILITGGKVRTDKIDFDKEPELKKLFDETRYQQEEMIRLKNQPFENLTIDL